MVSEGRDDDEGGVRAYYYQPNKEKSQVRRLEQLTKERVLNDSAAQCVPKTVDWDSELTNRHFQLPSTRVSEAQRKKWNQWCATCMGRCHHTH